MRSCYPNRRRPKSSRGELTFSADLKASLEKADRENRRVFVDFTGVTCTNCKLNERNVFPQQAIAELLAKYRRVQLFTDVVPDKLFSGPVSIERAEAFAQANLQFQREKFGSEQLPLYAIIDPSGGRARVTAIYTEGKINKVDDFIKFLEDGIK